MKHPIKFFYHNLIQDKRFVEILKILLNLIIIVAIIYIIFKKKIKIYPLFNASFMFVVFFEFFIVFFISLRILFLSRALDEKISLKNIYLITLTTKFYNIFFPSLIPEAIRGIKYFLAGIKNKYNVVSLVLFDRLIGFITFFIIFLISALSMKPFLVDNTLLILSSIFSLAFLLILFNIVKIKTAFSHNSFYKDLSKKELFFSFGISFIVQMAIMMKYFYIFKEIIKLNFNLIKTIYICSASHLSQIIPLSTGVFSIKDGFLFYIINTEQSDYNKALSLIVVLGAIEIIIGIAGGIVESINLTKKSLNYKIK